MTRSAYRGRCGHQLGWMSPAGVLHPLPGTALLFVDLLGKTATLRCPVCRATMQYRGGRVDLNGEKG
jgi:hypothetical protein